MLRLLMYCILLTLGIIGCASVVPIINVVLFKIKEIKEGKKTRTIYKFSSELFETEYSETMWQEYNDKYEKRKYEEYIKKLP